MHQGQQDHRPVTATLQFDSLGDLEDAVSLLRAATERAQEDAATDPVDADAARAFGRMATGLQCASWVHQVRTSGATAA